MLNEKWYFKPDQLAFQEEADYIARLPAGMHDRQFLFKTLHEKLKFPDYFGYNWDALEECLRDLSWITQKRVILVHQDIPLLNPKEKQTYLDILKTGSEYWNRSDQHKLLIIFP